MDFIYQIAPFFGKRDLRHMEDCYRIKPKDINGLYKYMYVLTLHGEVLRQQSHMLQRNIPIIPVIEFHTHELVTLTSAALSNRLVGLDDQPWIQAAELLRPVGADAATDGHVGEGRRADVQNLENLKNKMFVLLEIL